MMASLTKEMRPALEGVIPSPLATLSSEGLPNITYISQVYYVDDEHVALSFQFMNKSWRNMLQQPHAAVHITSPETGKKWILKLQFIEEQCEGPLFDEMEMQLMAITSTHGVDVEWKLLAALVCRIITIENVI